MEVAMTFKAVQLTGAPGPVTIITADSDNAMRYWGVCWWCKTPYESNDPDVSCYDCGEPIEFEDVWQPAP
jgi:rRNA maturation endonuclease Nob1